jgi:mitochondrial fission process protein 1
MFDKPVEEAVEWTFHRAFEYVGGPEAVGRSRVTERNDKISTEAKKLQEKKDL